MRSLYFTTNDQLGRPKDFGHRIARQASIVAGVRGGDALDNYGAGMGVNVGYAQPRGCLQVLSGIVNCRRGGCGRAVGGGQRRAAGGGNRLAVLRPDDRERRIALLDHAGHLGAQALRQVLLKAKGSYRGRNCTKKERERDCVGECGVCVNMYVRLTGARENDSAFWIQLPPPVAGSDRGLSHIRPRSFLISLPDVSHLESLNNFFA